MFYITGDNSVGLENLQITGGLTFDENGGGIFADATTVTISNSLIYNNIAGVIDGGDGGGIYSSGALALTNSAVYVNTALEGSSADGDGGGIASDGLLAVINSTIHDNNADDDGGGIDNDGWYTLISGSLIQDNFASGSGGGLDADGDTEIINTNVLTNTSDGGDGGGIKASDPLTVTSSLFQGNTAFEFAGGIYAGDTLFVTGTQVYDNQAGADGGGIFADPFGTIEIVNSDIAGNFAEFGGGVASHGPVTVVSSIVQGNGAFSEGGGFIFDSTFLMTDTQVLTNTALFGWGGGLTSYGDAQVLRSTFSGNSAPFGGAIDTEMGTLTVENSTIISNSAEYDGGALYTFETVAELISTEIVSNTAEWNAGGVYNDESDVTLTASTVAHNIAQNGLGGGIVNDTGEMLIGGSLVDNNQAGSGGGLAAYEASDLSVSIASGPSITSLPSGGKSTRPTHGASTSRFAPGVSVTGSPVSLLAATPQTTITNTTIQNNSAALGGGIFVSEADSVVTIANSTIQTNTAQSGGGIWNDGSVNVTIDGSQVSANTATASGDGTVEFEENFEAASSLPSGWSSSVTGVGVAWAITTTGTHSSPNSLFAPNPDDVGESILTSPVFTPTVDGRILSFWLKYATEFEYDGVVLEIDIGGGGFADILDAGGTFLAHGYNAILDNCCSNSLSDRDAWSGYSGTYVNVLVELPANGGQGVQLRWRMGSDDAEDDTGVWLDDITVWSPAGRGGGLYNTRAGNVGLDSSDVVSNTATQRGGGIFNTGSGSDITISNGSSVESNSAATSGGGIFNTAGSISFSNSALDANSATAGNGGGLWNESAGSVALDASSATGNSASASGGALFNRSSGSSLTLSNGSAIKENMAVNGGGIYNELAGQVVVNASSILSNTATGNGGGVASLDTGSALTLTNVSLVQANSAANGGGISNAMSGTVTLDGSRVLSNTATSGGGLSNMGAGSTMALTNSSTVGYNSANSGGGFWNEGSARIEDSQIVTNTATVDGGGLFNQAGSIDIRQSLLAGNTATTGAGGGLATNGINAQVLIDNSQFTRNSAGGGNGGGALYSGGTGGNPDSVEIRDSLLQGNSSTGNAGAALTVISTGHFTLTGSSILTNTMAGGAVPGAIYSQADFASVTDNCIFDNSDVAMQHFVSANTMDATGNWWGHASGPFGAGPGVGDSVGGDVNFSNFLAAPILGCPAFGDPDLAITKSASASSVLPGQPITFTLTFTNTGSRFGRGAVISDSLPANISFTDVTSSTSGSGVTLVQTNGAPDFAWSISDGGDRLAVDAGGVITLTGVISPNLNADGIITNTATITTSVDITSSNDLASAALSLTVPRVSFQAATASTDEGDGTATITVTLDSISPYGAVGVTVTSSDDSATAPADYTAVGQTVTIPAGSATVTFTVSIADDSLDENAESLGLTLSDPVGAALGTTAAMSLTITDNDPTPTLSIADVTVDEGAGTATFTVTLSAVSGLQVTVNYATADGTASAGSDYSAASGTLTITAGATAASFAVSITDDTLDENSETFTATLSSPVNATIADGTAIGTITDNDPTPTLSVADVTVNEGAGTATFTVTLSAASGLQVTVNYATADGTASAGSDYSAASGGLTIPAGSTQASFAVSILEDAIDENSETFTATLS
ncbi:MAG: Calx-beta domain-containing protein, partial [Rhizobiaceae bacterium]